MQKRSLSRSIGLLFLLFVVALQAAHASSKTTLRFGVFAYQGIEATTKEYEPLIAYLNQHSKIEVELIVATQQRLDELIKNRQLDIVTTNPIHFLDIRQKYALSGAVATLQVKYPNKNESVSKLGGVIVVPANSDIRTLTDIKGKRILTPSLRHMGGYRAQAYTLLKAGITLDSKNIIETKGAHQEVLHRLKTGEAEVGFIRDGIWEKMLSQGEIAESDFRIINAQKRAHPFVISTELYPEWPLFALPHVDEKMLKYAVGRLLSFDGYDDAYSLTRIAGYTLPADYLETEELSRALHLPPFDKVKIITVADVWKQYKINILLLLLLVLALGIYTLKERKNKLLFQALLTHMEDAAYAIDKNGNCVWINDQALKLLGFSRNEVLNKNAHKLFHHHRANGEVYEERDCPIQHTTADRKKRASEEHFIRKDGSFLAIYLTVAPIASTQGAIIVFNDISEQKAQQKALQESKDLFSTLFELFPEPIIIYDVQTHLPVIFNEAAYIQTGFSKEEFATLPLAELDAIETPEEVAQRVQKILTEGFDSFDTHHRLQDGRLVDVHVTVKRIEMQEKIYFLTLIRNITPIMNYQKALLKAKVHAEEANRAKSDFLANMSHEIRTPLNGIIGLTQLLLQMPLQPKEQDYISKIQLSSKMLLSIINDILDYSKIEANKLTLEHHDVVLSEFVDNIQMLFAHGSVHPNVTLTFEIDPLLPTIIRSDSFRLTQVLTNFLSNALKFTSKGTVEFSLKLKEQLSPTRALLYFAVRDTGIGIASENLPKLFSPFTQADSSITRQYGGTGLGLVISKRILDAMGATVEVKSRLGEGSLFGFELIVDVLSWEHVDTTQLGATLPTNDLSGLRVLLVEDNPINQEIAKTMLENAGVTVTLANNGLEGLEAFRASSGSFDTVLMDLQMPIMSGYEAASAIRQLDAAVPIIALTAAALVEDREKVLQAQMNDHLSKPIDMQQLYRLLAQWNHRHYTPLLHKYPPTQARSDEMPVLDREFALSMVAGNEELLDKLLKKLHAQLEGEFAAIGDKIAHNTPEARTLIHALKGVCGNLGAKALFEATQIVDAAFKKEHLPSQEEIARLNAAFEALKAYLTTLEQSSHATHTQQEKTLMQKGELHQAVETLKTDLKSATKIEQSRLETLTQALSSYIDEAQVHSWQRAIEEYEYDEALVQMQEWKL